MYGNSETMERKYGGDISYRLIPPCELTYPLLKAGLKMMFLFAGWDMLVPCRVSA